MQAPTLPKISIIMPVLNREDTLEKALLSVINQGYGNLELIILDGESKDGTLDIIKRYESHITYWHSQRDPSAAWATNIGIEKATGDIIALLMADDWLEPGTLHKIGAAALANPDAEILTCSGQIVAFDTNAKAYKSLQVFNTQKQLTLNFYNVCFAVSAICCRFIKKSLHERIGLYIPLHADGKQFLTNDKEFLLRAILQNAKDVFVDHMGYTYFAHSESYSFANNPKSAMRHCYEHMSIAQSYLAKPELSWRRKWLLRYWYNDQVTKLTLFQLLQRDFGAACQTMKNAWQQFYFLWAFVFVYTTALVVIKRSYRALSLRLRNWIPRS